MRTGGDLVIQAGTTVEDLQANPFFIYEIIQVGSPILLEQVFPHPYTLDFSHYPKSIASYYTPEFILTVFNITTCLF